MTFARAFARGLQRHDLVVGAVVVARSSIETRWLLR
jgi:hypothetical protein